MRFGLLGAREGRVVTRSLRSNRLLPELARRISRFELSRISGVCVVSGPGSFSSVRSGVLDANLLARLLRVPLAGVSSAEARDLAHLAEALASGSIRPSVSVLPTYIAEPNITACPRAFYISHERSFS